MQNRRAMSEQASRQVQRVEPSLLSIFEAAESVHLMTRRLLESMDKQIETIKLGDAEKVEELTDSYSTILSQFKLQEERLIRELTEVSQEVKPADVSEAAGASGAAGVVGETHESGSKSIDSALNRTSRAVGQVVRLSELVTYFPESAAKINNWRSMLENGAEKLARKHQQLASLLEFAVEQNSLLMYSIYQLSNRDNSHYGPDGKASEVKPGSAINHKA